MLFLIWSTARPGRKIAYVLAKDVFPEAARPAEIVTRFASAIPTLKNLSGNSLPKPDVFNESVVSAPRTMMSGFSLPSRIRDLEYSERMSVITASFIQNLPPAQFF